MIRQSNRQAAAQSPKDAATSVACRDRVAATIRRVAREDRRILEALAAFDRGERPVA